MSAQTKRIRIRPTSTQDVHEYIFEEPICEVGYVKFYQPLYGSEEMFSELGPIGEQIAMALLDPKKAEEIEWVAFRPFSATVLKNHSAGWTRLEEIYIMPAFKNALDARELEIEHITQLTDLRELRVHSFERARA